MATITELMQMDFNLYSGTASSGAYSPQLLAGLPGWSIVAISTSPSIDPTGQNWIDGYFGVAYYNSTTGELVIANRGTQLGAGASTAFHNLFSDLQLGLGGPTPEQNDAQSFAVAAFNAATGQHPNGITSVIETGHSLGGSEAEAAIVNLVQRGTVPLTQLSGVLFDSPGIGGYFIPETPSAYNVVDLYAQGDAIHLAGGTHLGPAGSNLIDVPIGPDTSKLAFGARRDHCH